MPALFLYSFKLSVCLGGIYLFYYLVLRNLTFYTWNRWFLLIGSGLAFLIPLFNVMPLLSDQESDQLKFISIITRLDSISQPFFYDQNAQEFLPDILYYYLIFFFGLGCCIQGGRLLIQFISFFHIRRSASRLKNKNLIIYQVDKNIAPFSFGKAIFLNKSLLRPAELQAVIRHELVHINQNHTMDILWFEFLTLLNWYNPFVWLIKRAVRQNLEFIADREVLLALGSDKKYYQYLMLKVIGLPNFSIANQFNISSLKTRIMMMNKTPSNRQELIKFLLIIPLMAVLVLACQDKADMALTEISLAQDSKTEVPPPPPPVPAAPEVPPPPPPVVLTADKLPEDQKVFLKRNPQIDFIGWHQDRFMLIKLKSGQEENYNLKNQAARELAEKKYGKLPQVPPPPPPTTL